MASATVEYRAEAFAFELHFIGVIPDTADTIISRYLRPTVQVSPSSFVYGGTEYYHSAHVTLSNYVWTIPGHKFSEFFVSEDHDVGHKVDIEPSEYTEPRPMWIYSEGGDYLVRGHFTVTIDGVAAEDRAEAATLLHVMEPTYDMQATTRDMRYILDPLGRVGGMSAGRISGPDYGISVNLRVLAPEEHLGVFCTVQLVKGTMKSHGAYQGISGTIYSVNGYAINTQGRYDLDTRWPQAPGATSAWYANNLWQQVHDSPGFWEYGSGTWLWWKLAFDLDFKMYLMFNSRRGGDWTPLVCLPWSVDAMFEGSLQTPYTPEASLGTIASSIPMSTRSHPTWTAKATASYGSGGGGGPGSGSGGGPEPSTPENLSQIVILDGQHASLGAMK